MKFFPKVRAAVKEAKEAVQAVKKAKRNDGEIDEKEAVTVVKECFDVADVVIGEVTLSPSAKNVLRAAAEELLRRLE